MMTFTKFYAKALRQDLEQMLAELYTDEKLRARVRDDINERGTADLITSGLLVLPHPRDAALHFDRLDAANQPPEE